MQSIVARSVPALAPALRGCTNLKLKQASRLVARLYEAQVGPTGLHKTQYSLLSHVVELGPVAAGELARHMRLDASTLSRNLQPMLAAGWIEIAAGDDGRQRIVSATAAGAALRAEAQRAWKRAQVGLNERLGAERVAALHQLLDDLVACLEDGQA